LFSAFNSVSTSLFKIPFAKKSALVACFTTFCFQAFFRKFFFDFEVRFCYPKTVYFLFKVK
jgi:hypothetical protein